MPKILSLITHIYLQQKYVYNLNLILYILIWNFHIHSLSKYLSSVIVALEIESKTENVPMSVDLSVYWQGKKTNSE